MRTLDSDWLFLRFYRHKTKLGVNCFVKSINLEKGMVMFAKINCGNILYIFIFFGPTSSHLPLDKDRLQLNALGFFIITIMDYGYGETT